MRFRSTLIEFVKRKITYNKTNSYYENGENNDYSERIDRLINNSVTAKQCANIMAVFLVGKGFYNKNTFDLGGLSLIKFAHKVSYNLVRQRGVFIHFNYNLNYDKVSAKVIPFNHCRVGKKDSDKYNGKIGICEDWNNSKSKNIKWIDIYNSNKEIIKYQIGINKDDDINIQKDKLRKYNGQILYVNLDDDYIYPLSTIDAVQNDCDSESQASIYKNRSLRKGFFGKTLIVTKPLIDAVQEHNPEEFKKQDGERRAFKKTVQSFIGAENNEGVLHIEMEFDDQLGIDKSILFKSIETNIDDGMFEFTETSVSNNILFSFGIPKLLVKTNDSSIYGQGGDGIYQAKLFYQDQTEQLRQSFIEIIKETVNGFKDFYGIIELELLIKEKDVIN